MGTKKKDEPIKPSMMVSDAQPKTDDKDAEIRKLRQQLEEYESLGTTSAQEDLDHLQSVANQASELGVKYSEMFHKSVYLYKELGDRIGPYHPATAMDIVKRWSVKGYRLHLRPRTPEQIEAYKKTDKYKERTLQHEKKRERMVRTSQRGLKSLAKEIGVAVADGIKPRE